MARMKRAARFGAFAITLVGALAWSGASRADEVSADVSTSSLSTGGTDDDSGAVVLAGKVGGNAQFNGLSPFVVGGIELGYAFGTKRRLVVLLDAEYTQPKADGDETEDITPPRVENGSYKWELTQRQLSLQPTLLYRLAGIMDVLTPYAGIGPRIFFVQTTMTGEAGGQSFPETTEQSTNFGLGIPLGVEVKAGPGGILAELSFQWAPINQKSTGESALAGLNLFLGYRAML